MAYKIGTKEKPMVLKTPPLSSEYTMHVDQKDGKDVLVCTVGKTVLLYNIDILEDLHKMLKKHGDWMELGSADEQKPAKEGTVEFWGRSEKNPVGGWYGLNKFSASVLLTGTLMTPNAASYRAIFSVSARTNNFALSGVITMRERIFAVASPGRM